MSEEPVTQVVTVALLVVGVATVLHSPSHPYPYRTAGEVVAVELVDSLAAVVVAVMPQEEGVASPVVAEVMSVVEVVPELDTAPD